MNYIIRSQAEKELYHHGVLGMRWGVRRYQNKDGSLTPAGLKRAKRKTVQELKQISKKYKNHTDSYKRKVDAVEKEYERAEKNGQMDDFIKKN